MSLRTALECAVERSTPTHIIPPITDPIGRGWRQPDRFTIEIDDTHAIMTQATFDGLAEYSTGVPTGVYPGKMWKRRHWKIRFQNGPDDTFTLCWFSEDQDPGYCKNNYRNILIV